MPTVVTKTVGPSGSDYTTLSAALTGELAIRADLVSRDEQLDIEIAAGTTTESSEVSISGWTADATRFVRIKAKSGDEVDGRETGGAAITVDDNFAFAMVVESSGCAYFRMQDVRVENINTNNARAFKTENASNGPFRIERCVFKTPNNGRETIEVKTESGDSYVRNNLIVNGDEGLMITAFSTAAVHCDNNTCVGSVKGIVSGGSGSGSIIFRNNVSEGSSTNYSGSSSFVNAASTNNAYVSGTVFGSNPVLFTTAAFTDYAGGDYTPTASGALDDAGADLSSDFTDDITGATRTQWDIGAFAIVGGGGATVSAADSIQGQSTDSVILTQGYVITASNVSQGQSTGEVTLSQGYSATLANSSQSQALDSTSLTQALGLAAAESAQPQSLDATALVQGYVLTPNGLEQSQDTESATLTQAHIIVPVGSTQSQAIDSVLLSQAGTISALDSEQSQSLAGVALTVAGSLSVDGTSQSQLLASLALMQGYNLTAADLRQSQALESTALSLGGSVVDPADSEQAMTLDTLSFTQYHVLAVDDLSQSQITELVNLGGVIIGSLSGKVVIYAALAGELDIQ